MARKTTTKTTKKSRQSSSNGRKRSTPSLRSTTTRNAAHAPTTGHARKAILVLGMHRSGTSAVTRVLGLCGATLPRRLMQPVPGNNDLGFWEPVEISKTHDRVLAEAGTSWSDLADVPSSFFQSNVMAGYVTTLRRQINEDYGDSALFVVKDPRLCRLVPLWIEVLRELPADPAFVIPIRNPLEVAKSLEARDRMTVNQGLLLWLRHFLTAERETRRYPRAFCHYVDLLNDWRSTISAIERRLAIHLPRRSHLAEAEIDNFLVRSARHQVAEDEQLMARRDVLSWVKTAYRWAIEAVAGADPSPDQLDELDRIFSEAEAAFNPVIAQGRLQCEHVQRHARQLAGDVTSLQSEVERKQAEADELRGQLDRAADDCDRSSRRVQDLERQLDDRDEELATLLEWSKLAVRWATQALAAGARPTPQLERIYLALESASPKQLPQLAAQGFELAERDRFQQTLDDLRQERDELVGRLNTALARCQEAEQRQAQSDHQYTALESQLNELRNRHAQLDETCRGLTEQRQAQARQLQALDAVLEEAGISEGSRIERLRQLPERIRQAELRCSTAADQCEELSARCIRVEEAYSNLQQQFTRCDEERKQAVSAYGTVTQERDQAQQEVASLRAALEAESTRAAQCEELSARCIRLEEAYSNLQQQFTRCDEERKQAVSAYGTVTQERDRAYSLRMKALSARDELASRLEEVACERDQAQQEVASLRAALEADATRAAQLESRLRDALAQLEAHEAVITDLRAELRATDKERLRISSLLSGTREERDKLQASVTDLAAKLGHLRSERVTATQELDASREQARRSDQEIARLREDLKKARLAAEERELLVVIQRNELDRIKSSAAWRLTRPFRAAAGASRIARGSSTDGAES